MAGQPLPQRADGDASGIRLVLQIDTAVHPPEGAERWTAALERLLCAAAPAADCPAPPDADPWATHLPAG